MCEYYLCKMIPKGTFHIGSGGGIGLEKTDSIIHSDTLYSGIAEKYFRLFDDGEKVFYPLEESKPKFVLSSIYPFSDEILFFPRPKVKANIDKDELEDPRVGKKLKKLEFLSEEMFLRYMGLGEKISLDDQMLFDDKILVKPEEKDKLINSNIKHIYQFRETPRNVLDRETNRSEIFYIGELEIDSRCGLYFLIELVDQSIMKRLEAAITLLGEEGIGGDRTVGKGQFEPTLTEYKGNMFKAENSFYFVTLSLFLPSRKEIQNGLLDGEDVSYEIDKRGGWIYSDFAKSQRKRTVRMFQEGSVFKNIGQEFYGKIIDVTPESFKYHPILKNGLAFKVNI